MTIDLVHVRDGYVAVDEAGEPVKPYHWSKRWAQLCREAGIRPVTLHAARHPSVTAMRTTGAIPDHVIAEWHGHDEVVMRRTYSHPDESSSRQPVRRCRGFSAARCDQM
jgi:integrase